MTSPKWKNPAAFEDVCEALEPFALQASTHSDKTPDWLYVAGITIGDLRRARAALSRARGETEEG